jgi:putative toxin-antitoxin system antitoxin component (TIGR02293 family)
MSLDSLERIYRAPGPIQFERLNKGVKAYVFRALAHSMDISVKKLAESLGLSERTLRYRIRQTSARKKGVHLRVCYLTGDETERSYRAYMVFRRAKEVLGNAMKAQEWIQAEQRALGNRTPLSMLARDVGAGTVLNILDAIEDGGYL